ncbi:OmpL47-type beta-barrel domain-containing protein [Streptomyces aidingensis]|uniref:Glycosyl hydrolases family 43 n=1 Tax=Streptomyces aidingensis TaxID=910347 RepID=A0A1I1ULX9_9ACTN|nr:LamG-like jellyroll fold domain-containing protein [Streptomyces aidingensis]SFD71872.1 Glycosyl hydrolases family 43 [Streptomyces aidingensis]
MRKTTRRRAGIGALLSAALLAGSLTVTAAPTHAAEAPDPGLVAWYRLDETEGTRAADSSGNGNDGTVEGEAAWRSGAGFAFTGGPESSGNAIRLPDSLLAGLDEITVDFDVSVDPGLTGNWFMFNLGNRQNWPDGDGYLFVTGSDADGRLRAAMAESGHATEQSATAATALPAGAWKHITYTVRGGSAASPGTARLYVDGTLVAENSGITSLPGAIGEPDGVSAHNWLGRSAYPADNSFAGMLRDFRIYDRALAESEVTARMAAKAQEAADAVTLTDADGVRENLTLPTAGAYGAELTWRSADESVVTATGEVTRPEHGAEAVTVPLTVTASLAGATATRTIPVTVLPRPAPAPYEAYFFPYFAGESTDDGEKIYFAASKGNDPTAWDELNGARPVLTSTMGERGLRDPFLIRSPEGDKFYLLATDLKIYGGNNFGEAQESGSRHLMVWESTDLVHWSDQRMVKVSSDFAGNTWAPEAFWDEASGQYVVYWASNLYPTTDVESRDVRTTYNRMMYATTRDFRTFSEARPWVDVQRGAGLGMIDATVVRDGDTFYRFIKDEASMTIRQERSTDLMAQVSGELPTASSAPWSLVAERIGVGQPNPWGGTFTGGEGPTVFRDNVIPDRWHMLIDQPGYHGGQGYLAFYTDDIASGSWTSVPEAELPSSPRHGTVIPVSQDELDALRAAYQPHLLATAAAPAEVRTREGVAPELPATVEVGYADGSTRATAVDWDEVAPGQYAAWGTFRVEGALTGQRLRAEATVTVTDAADPVVELGTDPDGPDGLADWFTVPVTARATATDDTGVRQVELSLDDGATWTATDGGEASLPLGDGRHTVLARAADLTGNVSAPVGREIAVDTEAPVSRAVWNGEDRTVTIASADNTSGVARVEYLAGAGSSWTVYTGPLTFGDVATTVLYRAVDHAGLVEQTNSIAVPRRQLDATTTTATLTRKSVGPGGEVSAVVEVTGGAATPTGEIRILSGGDLEVGRGTLSGGRATIAIDTATLGTGTWRLTVGYAGDDNHATSAAEVTLKVRKR